MTLDDVLALCEPEPNSGCWLYLGKLNRDGYGPHRRIWLRLGREISRGYDLDHSCAVRPCLNPSHLQPMTHRENCARAADRRAGQQPDPQRDALRLWKRTMRRLPNNTGYDPAFWSSDFWARLGELYEEHLK